MYKSNVIVYSLLFLLSALLLVWLIPAYTPESVGYGLSPAFLPYVLAIIMLICSGWLLLKTLVTGAGRGEAPVLGKTQLLTLIKYMPVFFLAFPLMSWIGFIPAACIVLVILQYLSGQRKPLTIALVTIITTMAAYCFMHYGMQVPMP